MLSHQAKYCERILERYQICLAKAAPAPPVDDISDLLLKGFISKAEKICTAKVPYRGLMGNLLY